MRKIRIGYRTFDIQPFPDGFEARLDGLTDFDRLVINISDDMADTAKACTLLHEIFHVCWDTAALKDGDGEERIVSALSNLFSQVIQDNPELLKTLSKGLK
jgi:hypothetical protein